MSSQPVPTLKRLDMNYCVDDSYVICTKSLGSAVYECGKSYGNFRIRDKGIFPTNPFTRSSRGSSFWKPPDGIHLGSNSTCRKFFFFPSSTLKRPVFFFVRKLWSYSFFLGVGYLAKLCPNLEYLTISYPHVVWSDASSARPGGMNLQGTHSLDYPLRHRFFLSSTWFFFRSISHEPNGP